MPLSDNLFPALRQAKKGGFPNVYINSMVKRLITIHFSWLLKPLDDLLADLIDGSLLIIESFGQEGLLLAYPSPCPMLIDKTVQEILMTKDITVTETGNLRQHLRYLFSNLISLPCLPFEMVRIECFRQPCFWVNRFIF